MIKFCAASVCLFLFFPLCIFAEGRPNNTLESSFTAGSGDYGQTVYKLSSDNNLKAGQYQVTDRIEHIKSFNSDSAVLSQFNIFNLMLGIKYYNNSITGIAKSSHEDIEDTFSDIEYIAGYNYLFKMSQDTEFETGIWCTNAIDPWIFKKGPFILPLISISTRFENISLKLGIMNLVLWRGKKAQIMVLYVPVWASSVSFRYSFSPSFYSELYSASNFYSVNSSKLDDKDKFNLLSCMAGLRLGITPYQNIKFSFGGGYVPYSREWIGTVTSGIRDGKNLDGYYFGEVKASIFI